MGSLLVKMHILLIFWVVFNDPYIHLCLESLAMMHYVIKNESRTYDRHVIFEMNVIKAIQNYVNKMIDSVSGMKVLLLDEETV